MNAQVEELEREVAQPSMALVTAIQKAEIDQQMTTARAFPRSIKRFTNECMDMATLSEDVAESCMYAMPRAGKTIEGPSARFAEIIQSAWGNTRAGARVIDEGDEFVTAEGVFHDLERNNITTMHVKRRITDRDGKRFNTDMIAVTGNAACSIAHRNAVLKGIPKPFWDPMYQAARKTAVGDIKSLANKRAEALLYLQKSHVSEAMALARLGVDGIEDIGLDELAILKGAIAAIKAGELTVEQAFAPLETKAPQGKPKTEAPKKKGRPAKDTTPAKKVDLIGTDHVTALRDKLHEEGVKETLLLAKFSIGALEELALSEYLNAVAMIEELGSTIP
jgi:hypothetical protein